MLQAMSMAERKTAVTLVRQQWIDCSLALGHRYIKYGFGFDLFNDNTRPSGHFSRPTQVNVSELLQFSEQITQAQLYCSGLGTS